MSLTEGAAKLPLKSPPKTIDGVLHVLWSHSKSSLAKREEKKLWMMLQRFVERNGGMTADVCDYRV